MRVRKLTTLAAITVVLVLLVARPAEAQTYVGVTAPEVGSVDPGLSGQVLSASGTRPPAGGVLSSASLAQTAPAAEEGLAFTGADIMGMVAIAGFCILVGFILRRGGRLKT